MSEKDRRNDNRIKHVVVPCSGAPDVGEISDRAARQLAQEGEARLACLAAIVARLRWVRDALRQADSVLVIDGCGEDCARKALEAEGIANIRHVRVTDLDMEEGHSPATPIRVSRVVAAGRSELDRGP